VLGPGDPKASGRYVARVVRDGRALPGVMLVHMNSDHWKSELHQRLMMPAASPTAITLYDAASVSEHREFSEHLTAEKQIEKYVEGRGEVIAWDRVSRNNHWLDSTYSAVCAGEAVLAFRAISAARKQKKTLGEMAGR
jgi:hypothetical protein